jgi:NAD(P)-dependent dehydrogenase (short-subunit alcohol dehydrogenase family)
MNPASHFKGKPAMQNSIVVTGAAGALGAAVSEFLIAQGFRVVGVDIAPAEQRLASMARSLGHAFVPVAVLIGDSASLLRALAPVFLTDFPLAGAVLVAGGWAGGEPLHGRTDDSTYRSMMAMNLDSVHAALRVVLPELVERQRGSVVVIGSQVVERPWTGAGAAEYTASKAAVVALAQAVAAEVRPFGVRINAVLPSTLDTPANRSAMPDTDRSRWVTLRHFRK